MCLVSEEKLMYLAEKYICDFLDGCPDIEELVPLFWQKHRTKLKPFYKQLHRSDDVIISASFGFVLRYIAGELGVENLVCSEVDIKERKVIRLCYRGTKVSLFKDCFPDSDICDFYTDSLNDLPMMKLAKGKVFMVKGNKIEMYDSERLGVE